jgi:hypothetical protein
MRNPHGYATIIGPPITGTDQGISGVQEFDTLTCIHSYCRGSVSMTRSKNGKIEIMVFRADGTHYMKEAGFCRSCMAPICPICTGKPCSNKFAKLDEDEMRAYQAQQRFVCS